MAHLIRSRERAAGDEATAGLWGRSCAGTSTVGRGRLSRRVTARAAAARLMAAQVQRVRSMPWTNAARRRVIAEIVDEVFLPLVRGRQ